MCNAITVLCKVVDNYGDIGFVYRLARSLKEKNPDLKINLVVSNLSSFKLMAPDISEGLAKQNAEGFTIYDWNADEVCEKDFSKNPPVVIFECFECGRPEWLEKILFAENATLSHIVSIEYLSAEDWVEEFHLLPSATRSARVKKINFMPGFTKNTGGLVLDSHFAKCAKDRKYAVDFVSSYLPPSVADSLKNPSELCILLFSYPRDFSVLVKAISFLEQNKEKLGLSCVRVLSATKEFNAFAKNLNAVFKTVELPALPQPAWDALLCSCDFLFVRGEDSFSRACLSGIPFLWKAYIQKDEQQLVKTLALVLKLKPHFSDEDFLTVQKAFLSYNYNDFNLCGSEARDALSSCEAAKPYEKSASILSDFLMKMNRLKKGFSSFSESLFANGNLTDKVMELISGWQSF